MTGIIEHVANVMVPVLLCVLLGYALAYFKAPYDRKLFGSLVSNVGYPTLILSHLAKEHIQLETFLAVLGAALAMVAIFGVLGFVVLKLMRVSIRA
ncbi:MAG: transporter, partial [Pseudomonadota bacterium]